MTASPNYSPNQKSIIKGQCVKPTIASLCYSVFDFFSPDKNNSSSSPLEFYCPFWWLINVTSSGPLELYCPFWWLINVTSSSPLEFYCQFWWLINVTSSSPLEFYCQFWWLINVTSSSSLLVLTWQRPARISNNTYIHCSSQSYGNEYHECWQFALIYTISSLRPFTSYAITLMNGEN